MKPAMVARHIIHSLGHNDPCRPTGTVMIEGLLRLLALDCAVAIQGPEARLLPGSDAPHRLASGEQWRFGVSHRATLWVPIRADATWQPLGGLPTDKAQICENPPHDAPADGRPTFLLQRHGEVPWGSIGPQNGGAHRLTGTAVIKELLDVVDHRGLGGFRLFFPPPGRRIRSPAGACGQCWRSWSPWAIRSALHPNRVVREVRPPCPTCTASTAA